MKMKSVAVLSVLAVLFSVVCAFSAVQELENFTIDVPEGWTLTKDGPMLILQKDANKHVGMLIRFDSTNGHSGKELSDILVTELRKTFTEVSEPEADEDGDYSFVLKDEDGTKGVGFISVMPLLEKYLMVVMSGGSAEDLKEMQAIAETIKAK
jgi:hypothetical protein